MGRKFQYQHIKSPPAAAESLSKRMENMNALPLNSKRVSVPVLRQLRSPRTPKPKKLRKLVSSRPRSAGPTTSLPPGQPDEASDEEKDHSSDGSTLRDDSSKFQALMNMVAGLSNKLVGLEAKLKNSGNPQQAGKLEGPSSSGQASAVKYPPPLQTAPRFEERKEEVLRNQQNGVYGSAFAPAQFDGLLNSMGSTSTQVPFPNQYARNNLFGAGSLHGQNVLEYNITQVKDLLLSSNSKHWEKVFASLSSFYKYITEKKAWFPGHPEHDAFNSLYHMASAIEAMYTSWPLAKKYLLYIWDQKAKGVDWKSLTVACPPSGDYWDAIPVAHQVRIVGWQNAMNATPAGGRSTTTPAPKGAPKNAEDEAVNAANNAINKLDHDRCPGKNQFSGSPVRTARYSSYCANHKSYYKTNHTEQTCRQAVKADGTHRR